MKRSIFLLLIISCFSGCYVDYFNDKTKEINKNLPGVWKIKSLIISDVKSSAKTYNYNIGTLTVTFDPKWTYHYFAYSPYSGLKIPNFIGTYSYPEKYSHVRLDVNSSGDYFASDYPIPYKELYYYRDMSSRGEVFTMTKTGTNSMIVKWKSYDETAVMVIEK